MDNRDRTNEYRNQNDIDNRDRNDLNDTSRSNISDHNITSVSDRERDRRDRKDEIVNTDYKHRDENRRLHFLNDLSDYKVASGDPDVRGWDVVDVNNRKVGKVDNLLVDISKEKVRYLDVDLDQEMLHKDHDPLDNNDASGVHEYRKNGGDVHMIVPIGLARVDSSNKRVISDDINRSILEEGHTHRKGEAISTDYERNVVGCIRNCDSETTASHRSNETENINRMGSSTVRSETSGTERTETNPFASDNTTRVSRDRGPSSLRDQTIERRTGDEQNRGPIQDDFYNNRYFDDRRFFGR